MYSQTTRDIVVTVQPTYLDEESDPSDNRYVWAYQVQIVNRGEVAVQLLRRHWIITDAMGRVQEVKGAGVVGEQPVLRPGEAFEYTSGTPLTTSSGIMRGSYEMEAETGEVFHVAIPAFSLDSPHEPISLN